MLLETNEAVNDDGDADVGSDEQPRQPDSQDRQHPASSNCRRRRRRSLSSGANRLLLRVRNLQVHLNHPDRSVAILRNLSVRGDETYGSIMPAVVTSWTSSHDSIARLYALYTRLTAFFISADVSVSGRKHRLTSDD